MYDLMKLYIPESTDNINDTLLGILLTMDSLSVSEQTILAKQVGFGFETQFFQVFVIRPIFEITEDRAGDFIDRAYRFRETFLAILRRYGYAYTTHFRKEMYFVLNYNDNNSPITSKDNYAKTNRIKVEALDTLKSITDDSCPFLVTCSTVRHGVNSIYWCASEATGFADSFMQQKSWFANSQILLCNHGQNSTQSYIANYQFNKRLINMTMSLNFSSLHELIHQEITDWSQREAPAFRTRLDSCKASVMSYLQQSLRIIGKDIMFIESQNYLINSYLELPSSSSFEEFDRRVSFFLNMLSSSTRVFEDSMGKIHKIVDYIEHEYRDPNLNIGSLADKFCISRAHLSRIFKTAMGINISKYLELTRINSAKALLTAGLSISDTAQQCGYYDRRSFSGAFKRVEGLTPGAWLKQN